jgi:hypothetical protein
MPIYERGGDMKLSFVGPERSHEQSVGRELTRQDREWLGFASLAVRRDPRKDPIAFP